MAKSRVLKTKPEYMNQLIQREGGQKAALILGISDAQLYTARKQDSVSATVERLAKHEMQKREVQLPALRGNIAISRIPEEFKEVYDVFCKGLGIKVTYYKDL